MILSQLFPSRVVCSLFLIIALGQGCLGERLVYKDEDPIANQEWLPPSRETIERWNQRDPFQYYLDGVQSVTTIQSNSNGTTTSKKTSRAFGFKDIPNQIPMKTDDHFPIASNSKLYTTVAIYQLQEKGLLNVDADIATMLDHHDFIKFGLLPRSGRAEKTSVRNRTNATQNSRRRQLYCPRVLGQERIWNKCEQITLRNLLSMSSGIYPTLNCDVSETDTSAECNPDPYFVNRGSIAQTVGSFLLKPLIFKPGTEYHYSNPNFILATYFVEKYSGMTFRKYLETHIFSRIGLNDTYFDFFNQGMRLDQDRVGQYFKYYDNETEELISVGADTLQLDLGSLAGTGGIVSTVHDEQLFWYSLFNQTTQGAPLLLSPASLADILTAWTLINSANVEYPNGEVATLWTYFGQGIVMICESLGCLVDGESRWAPPKWIQYTGVTVTVQTANLLHYDTMKMVQVWTSTVVDRMDQSAFQDRLDQQTGTLLYVVAQWTDPDLNTPMALAWYHMYVSNDENPHQEPSIS